MADTEQATPEKSQRRWLGYALILLVPLGGFIYLLWFSAAHHDTLTFSTDETPAAVTLPDGSVVTLNEESTLYYPEIFDEDRRSVELEGEGFFEIIPNEAQPFYVACGPAEVRVKGTSFNLKSEDRRITLHVVSGEVRFAGRLEAGKIEPVYLKAGASATYLPDMEKMELGEDATDNFLFWKTHHLTYEDIPLKKVVKEVSDWYPGKIELKSAALENCRLTAEFEDQTIEEIANYLATEFSLELTRKDKTYTLKGDSCSE